MARTGTVENLGALDTQSVSIAGHVFQIGTVSDPDAWLDALVTEPDSPAARDERLPYWTELWPSAVALAEHILTRLPPLHGRQVLEVGCGLGLSGLAAASRGARVLLTDYQEPAVRLALHNAHANGLEVDGAVIDWRTPGFRRSFDMILAADVIYERRNFEPLLRLFAHGLAPGGSGWMTEPGRDVATAFYGQLEAAGLRHETDTLPLTFRGHTHHIRLSRFWHSPGADLRLRAGPTHA